MSLEKDHASAFFNLLFTGQAFKFSRSFLTKQIKNIASDTDKISK